MSADRRYLVLMGAPGAGKGTQAARVGERNGLCRISTGDLLRMALEQGTALGLEAEGYMKAGELVPDSLILGLVDEELDRESCAAGAVFDGFPRTVPQAEGFDDLLAKRSAAVESVLLIDVPENEILRRLSGRRVCKSCGRLYHLSFDPSRLEGHCDVCDGELVQRPDDRPETIERRLAVYHEETGPVLEYYASRRGVQRIDGQRPIDDVSAEVERRLDAVRSGT